MAGPIPFTPIINGNDVTIQRLSDSGEAGEETWGYNASINSGTYTISGNTVVWNDGTILQYNGIDVLPTNNIMDGAEYTTRAASTTETITSGKYKFLDTLTMPTTQIEQTMSFTANGINYTGIRITTDTMYYVANSTETEVYNTSSKWATEDSKNQFITFSTDTEVDGTFATWFTSNASKQKLSVDLTTLPGWANLSAGNHTIKIKAKGTGYKESELSAGVTVSKAPSTVTLEAGTYKFVKIPNLDGVVLAGGDYMLFSCKSYSLTANNVYGDLVNYSRIIVDETSVSLFPSDDDSPSLLFDVDDNTWKYDVFGAGPYTATDDNKLRTIIVETDQQVSQEFYNWAITQGNLVKQAGYKLTLQLMAFQQDQDPSNAYIKINSDTVSSTDYDYMIQGSPSSIFDKNGVRVDASSALVITGVYKVAWRGAYSAYLIGEDTPQIVGSQYTLSTYELSGDTTLQIRYEYSGSLSSPANTEEPTI